MRLTNSDASKLSKGDLSCRIFVVSRAFTELASRIADVIDILTSFRDHDPDTKLLKNKVKNIKYYCKTF